MGDAAEVLNALYDKLADVAARAGQPELLEESFGLHVRVSSLKCTVQIRFDCRLLSRLHCSELVLKLCMHMHHQAS